MLVDIHAKSSLSDDVDLSIRDVLDRASERGLDALAFCETCSTAYCRNVLDRAQDYDLDVFIGVEIPTDTGILLGFAPEIDDFYVSERSSPRAPSTASQTSRWEITSSRSTGSMRSKWSTLGRRRSTTTSQSKQRRIWGFRRSAAATRRAR
jgi:hypothetical protein